MAVTAGAVGGVLALVIAACSGSPTSNTDGGGGGSSACTIQVTGAVTGNYTCTVAFGGSASGDTIDAAIISDQKDGLSPIVSLGLKFPGSAWATQTYDTSTAGNAGGVTYKQGLKFWVADKGGEADQGTYSLTLTNAGSFTTDTAGRKIYSGTHGTADATMPALEVTGATGTATAHFSW